MSAMWGSGVEVCPQCGGSGVEGCPQCGGLE